MDKPLRPASSTAEITAATLRVIERHGLPAASVRAMAAEMGCATGVLALHYRAKDGIAALACNEATRTIAHRITAVEPGCDPVDLETGTRPGLLVWAER